MRVAAHSPNGEVGAVFLRRNELTTRVKKLGAEIAAAYHGCDLVLISPLEQNAPFLRDLSRALGIPHTVAVVEIAPYGRDSGRKVRLLKDPAFPLAGRHVLVVTDVIDTGLTAHFLCRTLAEQLPSSLAAVTLLDRPCRRLVGSIPLRGTGFTVPDELFAGYGIGLDERWRSLRDLHVVLGRPFSDLAREPA
jgi:hypoxanthine phosphoribosyltransferase